MVWLIILTSLVIFIIMFVLPLLKSLFNELKSECEQQDWYSYLDNKDKKDD